MRQERSVCLFDETHLGEFALGAMRSGIWLKHCHIIDNVSVRLTKRNLHIISLTLMQEEAS
jgi:hypothetical protein